MIALATLLWSWPVTTRRIGGYFGCSALMAWLPPFIDDPRLRATALRSCHYGAQGPMFCCCDGRACCGNLRHKLARERNHVDATPAGYCRSCRCDGFECKLRPSAGQAEGR